MSGGEFKSSLVQQMAWGGTDNRNIMSSLRPCAEEQEASIKMPPLSSPSMLFSHQLLHLSSGLIPEVNSTATSPASLHGGQESNMPESWSQLILQLQSSGGLVGNHERYSTATALLSKGLEEGPMGQAAAAYNFHGYGGGEEIQTSGAKAQLSQMLLASSPRSCITTSLGSNMLDFSNSAPAPELKNHQSDNSSESNNTATGSALKKARVQASSSAQSTLKVRKERLGDRITALHQTVSPFGKTDTASVLQETIGYIRFLLGQIEALSYPYLGHGTGNYMHQQTGPAGERNPGLFPQFPGQLLNHSKNNNGTAEAGQTEQGAEDGGEGKKDLRSRGLCLVPVSCTSHLGADNGSDFWAPVPAPLGGIILR